MFSAYSRIRTCRPLSDLLELRPALQFWRFRNSIDCVNPAIVIREATATDASQMWGVLKDAVRKLVAGPYTTAQVDAWIADENPASASRGLRSQRRQFVAVSQRRVVGFARIAGHEIEALYVHPEEAGRRIGERLLATLERSAMLRDVKTLHLDAALNAVSFYESAGYQALGPSAPVLDNGLALPCVRMRKVLHQDRHLTLPFACHPCRGRTQACFPVAASNSGAISCYWRRML